MRTRPASLARAGVRSSAITIVASSIAGRRVASRTAPSVFTRARVGRTAFTVNCGREPSKQVRQDGKHLMAPEGRGSQLTALLLADRRRAPVTHVPLGTALAILGRSAGAPGHAVLAIATAWAAFAVLARVVGRRALLRARRLNAAATSDQRDCSTQKKIAHTATSCETPAQNDRGFSRPIRGIALLRRNGRKLRSFRGTPRLAMTKLTADLLHSFEKSNIDWLFRGAEQSPRAGSAPAVPSKLAVSRPARRQTPQLPPPIEPWQ